MFRFTIRDMLMLTAVIAIALSGVANFRTFAAAAKNWSAAVWNDMAQIGPPLMGRDSGPPDL